MYTPELKKFAPYPFQIEFSDPRYNVAVHIASAVVAEAFKLPFRLTVNGHLLKEGAAVIISNHDSAFNTLYAHWLAGIEHRPLRSWAKKSLVEFVKESKRTQSRRERTDFLNTEAPSDKGIKARTKEMALDLVHRYVRCFNPIVVDLDGDKQSFQRTLDESAAELDEGRLVWIFIQGTRSPKDDLLECQPGAAVLAAMRPEVPIIPVGLSMPVNKFRIGKVPFWFYGHGEINIGTSFTYSSIPDLTGEPRRNLSIATRYMASYIAPLVSSDLKCAWELENVWGIPRKDFRNLIF